MSCNKLSAHPGERLFESADRSLFHSISGQVEKCICAGRKQTCREAPKISSKSTKYNGKGNLDKEFQLFWTCYFACGPICHTQSVVQQHHKLLMQQENVNSVHSQCTQNEIPVRNVKISCNGIRRHKLNLHEQAGVPLQ